MGMEVWKPMGKKATQPTPSCLLQGMGKTTFFTPRRTSPPGGKSPSGRCCEQAACATVLTVSLAHGDPNTFAACQLLHLIQ